MLGQESDAILFCPVHPAIQTKVRRTKISLNLLANGHIFIDWNDLPTHQNIREYVVHYKSLNNNRVKQSFVLLLLNFNFNKYLFQLELCDTCITEN